MTSVTVIKAIGISKNTTCLLSIIVNLALSANRTTVSEFKLVPPKNLLKK